MLLILSSLEVCHKFQFNFYLSIAVTHSNWELMTMGTIIVLEKGVGLDRTVGVVVVVGVVVSISVSVLRSVLL